MTYEQKKQLAKTKGNNIYDEFQEFLEQKDIYETPDNGLWFGNGIYYELDDLVDEYFSEFNEQ